MKQAVKAVGADKVIGAYFAFFLIMAVLLLIFEPSITTFGDSLWYCFATATTVGFGDLAAVSLLGRILTVLLSLYSIVFVAIITALITSLFMETVKARANESVAEFLDELENLPELDKDELADLSERVKKFAGKVSEKNK